MINEKESREPIVDQRERTGPVVEQRESWEPMADEKERWEPTADEKESWEPMADEKESWEPMADEKESRELIINKEKTMEAMVNEAENRQPIFSESGVIENPERAATIDRLLEVTGGCGRFQLTFVALGYLPVLCSAWSLMFMVFGSFNPGWKCLDDFSSNDTKHTVNDTNSSTFVSRDGWNVSESVCYKMKTCGNGTFSNEASTIVTEWSLVCSDAWALPLIISIQMSGVTMGSHLGGQIGEKLGRKLSIHVSVASMVVTNILAAFSVSWQMYAAVRFFIGLATGCILSSLVVFVMEFLTIRWRGFLGTFPFWNIATLTFGLCVLALRDWRHVHFATAVLSFIAFLPVFWLPESMRYLTVHGHLKAANDVVRQITKWNRKPLPDTRILNAIAEEETNRTNKVKNYTYLHLFRKRLRKTNIVLGMAWLILSIGYFVIGFGIKTFYGDFFMNFLLFSVLSIPMRLVATVFATKVGRKFTAAMFILLACGCSFSVVGIQLLAPEEGKGKPTVAMALGANVLMEAAWGAVVVLVVELNPTAVRNLAYGYCNGLARTGSIIAPYLIPRDAFPIFGAFLLLGLLQLICFLGLLTLLETKNKPLQDNLRMKTPNKSAHLNQIDVLADGIDASSRGIQPVCSS